MGLSTGLTRDTKWNYKVNRASKQTWRQYWWPVRTADGEELRQKTWVLVSYRTLFPWHAAVGFQAPKPKKGSQQVREFPVFKPQKIRPLPIVLERNYMGASIHWGWDHIEGPLFFKRMAAKTHGRQNGNTRFLHRTLHKLLLLQSPSQQRRDIGAVTYYFTCFVYGACKGLLYSLRRSQALTPRLEVRNFVQRALLGILMHYEVKPRGAHLSDTSQLQQLTQSRPQRATDPRATTRDWCCQSNANGEDVHFAWVSASVRKTPLIPGLNTKSHPKYSGYWIPQPRLLGGSESRCTLGFRNSQHRSMVRTSGLLPVGSQVWQVM